MSRLALSTCGATAILSWSWQVTTCMYGMPFLQRGRVTIFLLVVKKIYLFMHNYNFEQVPGRTVPIRWEGGGHRPLPAHGGHRPLFPASGRGTSFIDFDLASCLQVEAYRTGVPSLQSFVRVRACPRPFGETGWTTLVNCATGACFCRMCVFLSICLTG